VAGLHLEVFMIDLDAVNADPLLKDTPIGDLQVVLFGQRIVVSVDSKIVYEMGRYGNPWGAIYGKRAHEATYAQAQMAAEREAREASVRRESDDVSEQLIREQERMERRDSDFKDLMTTLAGE
jgi:hypothetical protein